MSTQAMPTYIADDFKVNDARSQDKFQPKVRRSSKRLAKKKLQQDMMRIPQGESYHQQRE